MMVIERFLNSLSKTLFIKTITNSSITNYSINNTHREKLFRLLEYMNMAAWLLLTFFICLRNDLSPIHFIIAYSQSRCLKNVIHQIDNKNEWLLLSSCFTADLGLVFVLKLENAFSQRFYLIPLCLRDSHVFM